MKTGIIGILNNPAISENSHSSGMVNIVKHLFDADILTEKDDWSQYEKLIIYHGVNFKEGSFNIIGGLNDGVVKRAYMLQSFQGEVLTLDGFQLNQFGNKRKLNDFSSHKEFAKIKMPIKNKMVLGDSHSISVWPGKEYGIFRNDGKTLHGFLKLNLDWSSYKHVIMYFGNIDLRFHLCRQPDPVEATKDLFTRYCEYASRFNATITHLLPVEDESRVLPKTGQYKGQNFFGSMQQRKELRLIANKIMSSSGLQVIEWPGFFCDEKGELKFEIMEPRQSVHIKPKYYQTELKKQLTLF